MAGPLAVQIAVDNTIFLPALQELGTSSSNLCNPKFTLPERTSVSTALSEYENQIAAIENLLLLYQKLVKKDSASLKLINDELTRADESYSGIQMPFGGIGG